MFKAYVATSHRRRDDRRYVDRMMGTRVMMLKEHLPRPIDKTALFEKRGVLSCLATFRPNHALRSVEPRMSSMKGDGRRKHFAGRGGAKG